MILNPSLKTFRRFHGATAEELVALEEQSASRLSPVLAVSRGNTKPILYDAVAGKTADQSKWIMQIHDHGDWLTGQT